MNRVDLIGRLTKDPDVRQTQSGLNCAQFTLAVDRNYTDKDGNRGADFLPVVAWRGAAEFVGKWFKKGLRVAVTGSIQTRSYEAKDGGKRYVTEIIADHVEFCERRQEDGTAEQRTDSGETFTPEDDDDLPFELCGRKEVR